MPEYLRRRRALFEVESSPSLVTCPCCGYPTLGARAEFEICPICEWEDDGQDDADAETIRGGPNHGYSLAEARRNFEHYHSMYSPEDRRAVGLHRGSELRDRLIDVLDRIQAVNDVAEQERLWAEAHMLERQLWSPVRRRLP